MNPHSTQRHAEGLWPIIIGVHAVVMANGNAAAIAIDAVREQQGMAVGGVVVLSQAGKEFGVGDNGIKEGIMPLQGVVDGINAQRRGEGSGEAGARGRIDRLSAIATHAEIRAHEDDGAFDLAYLEGAGHAVLSGDRLYLLAIVRPAGAGIKLPGTAGMRLGETGDIKLVRETRELLAIDIDPMTFFDKADAEADLVEALQRVIANDGEIGDGKLGHIVNAGMGKAKTFHGRLGIFHIGAIDIYRVPELDAGAGPDEVLVVGVIL